MIEYVIIAVLVSMGLVILRALVGPTIFDRILASNSFGTNIVVLIVLVGLFKDTFYFIDIAITYALINFITTIALLRYFKFKVSESEKS